MSIERIKLSGVFTAWFVDKYGREIWRDRYNNTVMTLGKNFTLDTLLGGSAYTVTGPYMGLITDTSFSAISAADTMASHAGWLEAGSAHSPTYSGSRGTAAFSAASGGSKALSAPLAFSITASGNIKGSFIVLGPSASPAIDNTSGILFSAGLFSSGDQPVTSSGTLNVLYTANA